jgi:hypothetical protein
MKRSLDDPDPTFSEDATLLRDLLTAYDDPADSAHWLRHYAACDAVNRGQERADLLVAADELERGDRRATAVRIRRLAGREHARLCAVADLIERRGAP